MHRYGRNQVEEAVCSALGAVGASASEVKYQLKRLLEADRAAGPSSNSRNDRGRVFAFYSSEPRGQGVHTRFTGYEAFALAVALNMLRHGLSWQHVVQIMRRARAELENAQVQTLKEDPNALFDQDAISARAKPGMIAVGSTRPVFLAFSRATGSPIRGQAQDIPVCVCGSEFDLMTFVHEHSDYTRGVTYFELAGLMHKVAANLAETRPKKRGQARE
jgi:hypothetical protein